MAFQINSSPAHKTALRICLGKPVIPNPTFLLGSLVKQESQNSYVDMPQSVSTPTQHQ